MGIIKVKGSHVKFLNQLLKTLAPEMVINPQELKSHILWIADLKKHELSWYEQIINGQTTRVFAIINGKIGEKNGTQTDRNEGSGTGKDHI